ncbi:g664 [Coccomyxa viridis]|uniref:G664 protein n=1 Tax=Coccomyxa viridis TaxID=1274662 RepID=A0ABP1FG87_9CHLO
MPTFGLLLCPENLTQKANRSPAARRRPSSALHAEGSPKSGPGAEAGEPENSDSLQQEAPVERNLFVPIAVLVAFIGYAITAILAISGI